MGARPEAEGNKAQILPGCPGEAIVPHLRVSAFKRIVCSSVVTPAQRGPSGERTDMRDVAARSWFVKLRV
jgi:hypothetical protein